MTAHAPLRLALTMGDPAGIGPEIIAKATRAMRSHVDAGTLAFIVLGSADALSRAESQSGLGDAHPPYRMVDVGPVDAPVETGKVSSAGGEWAYRAVERAVRLSKGASGIPGLADT